MRLFALAYFAATVLAVLFVIVLQLPSLLTFFSILTLGLFFLFSWAFLAITFWMVMFLPAVLGAAIRPAVGLGIAALTVVALLTTEYWLPEPHRGGAPVLGAPRPAQGPVQAASVQIDMKGLPQHIRQIEDPILLGLLQNPALDWVRVRQQGRVKTRLFSRRGGVMHRAERDHGKRADVIIARPGALAGSSDTPVPELWKGAPLSPWKIDNVRGYLVHRGGEVLARNLELEVSRAEFPFEMEFTDIDMAGGARAQFVRSPYTRIARDPARRLSEDLRRLALIAPEAGPRGAASAGKTATVNTPARLDAMVRQILDDPELSGLGPATTRRSLDAFQRQVIDDFRDQLRKRIAISDRIELIALMHRSYLHMPKELLMELAEEEPALMQRLTDQFYTDLAEEVSYGDRRHIANVGHPVLAPLARAIGRDEARFRAAFLASKAHLRRILTERIFHFGLSAPYALLAEVFAPFPPVSEFEERIGPRYRASWADERWVENMREMVRSGYSRTKSEDEENADWAFRRVITREDAPDAVVRDFTRRWVLSRLTPLHHDQELITLAMEKLAAIGADDLRAGLAVYFQDLEKYF